MVDIYEAKFSNAVKQAKVFFKKINIDTTPAGPIVSYRPANLAKIKRTPEGASQLVPAKSTKPVVSGKTGGIEKPQEIQKVNVTVLDKDKLKPPALNPVPSGKEKTAALAVANTKPTANVKPEPKKQRVKPKPKSMVALAVKDKTDAITQTQTKPLLARINKAEVTVGTTPPGGKPPGPPSGGLPPTEPPQPKEPRRAGRGKIPLPNIRPSISDPTAPAGIYGV